MAPKMSQNAPKWGPWGGVLRVISSLFEIILGALEGHWATLGVFFSEVGEKVEQNAPLWRPKWPKGDQNGSPEGS